MAIRGRKPISPALRLILGGRGKRPQSTPPTLEDRIERPAKLRGAPAKLWDRYITRAYWLNWSDGPKALMWCHLQAEFEKAPVKMIASRIAQLRALGSELALDLSSRSRLGIVPATPKSAADEYLD